MVAAEVEGGQAENMAEFRADRRWSSDSGGIGVRGGEECNPDSAAARAHGRCRQANPGRDYNRKCGAREMRGELTR
jgi:hypothetical protein